MLETLEGWEYRLRLRRAPLVQPCAGQTLRSGAAERL